MGKDRDYRVIIPGALLLVGFFLAALAAGGFRVNPFPGIDGQWVTALVLLVVANFGGGFLCSNLTVLILNRRCRSRGKKHTKELRKILALSAGANSKEVWGEAHYRVHQRSEELIRFTTRRYTAMYACFNSAIALAVGWLIAVAGVLRGRLPNPLHGYWRMVDFGLVTVLVVFMAIVLWRNGRRAESEAWQVFKRLL